MSFKAPDKSVGGQLTLVIAKPKVEAPVEEEDLAAGLPLFLNAGYNISSTPAAVLAKNKQFDLKQIAFALVDSEDLYNRTCVYLDTAYELLIHYSVMDVKIIYGYFNGDKSTYQLKFDRKNAEVGVAIYPNVSVISSVVDGVGTHELDTGTAGFRRALTWLIEY